MWDRMRDTRRGHRKEEWKVRVYVCCRQTLERFIDRCVSKGVVETVGERPKEEENECARWIEC